MIHRILTSAVLLSLLAGISNAQQLNPRITSDELRGHVYDLATDRMEGRRSGTPGGDRAAEYIANAFKSFGLSSADERHNYLQTFEFVSSVQLGSNNQFVYSTPEGSPTAFDVDKSFRPLGFSSSESYSGPVVFVGYGLSLADKKYDDYEGIDVKDKAVLLLRQYPPIDSTRGAMDAASSLRSKAARAKEKGAKAVIVVTGPAENDVDDLIKLSYDRSSGDAGILSVNITREAADRLLAGSGKTIKTLQNDINTRKAPSSFSIPNATVNIRTDIKTVRANTANVVGYLPGNDATLKNEYVVIGAHYDHLGWGGEGSTKPDTHAIHFGADDNASGVAGMLELAEAFAAQKKTLKRSVVFIAFAGEELGLLGSGHYVKNPTFPLEQTVAMLNMDMIGRLTNKTLIIYGTGTSPGFDSLIRSSNTDSAFTLKLIKDGFGPSDHASFYGKKIPVFHFFTDLHPDYHSPRDSYDLLNYNGMEQVTKFISRIASEIERSSQRPAYAAVEAPRAGGNMGRSTKVWVGTVPDFGEQVEGMKLSGVRDGSPASKAGLKAGDVIVKFGKVDVKNLYDFTFAIGEYKPGDIVDVIVKRGAETMTVSMTLERRPN